MVKNPLVIFTALLIPLISCLLVLKSTVYFYKYEKRERENMYEYRAYVNRVVDGDTVDVDIDLGFGVMLKDERVRIMGIDTPESRTSDKVEKIFGLASKERLKELLGKETILKTQINKDGEDMKGKFGRILGDFIVEEWEGQPRLVTEIMIEEGHCVPYHGQNKADVQVAHMANRNRLMAEGVVDPKLVQETEAKYGR
jgi:micrococcal nuclease